MKPTFVLPTTKMSVVVWYRNGKKSEQLIETPRSNNSLFDLMLMKYHVGYSEIRAIKGVEPTALLGQRF